MENNTRLYLECNGISALRIITCLEVWLQASWRCGCGSCEQVTEGGRPYTLASLPRLEAWLIADDSLESRNWFNAVKNVAIELQETAGMV